MYNYHRAFMIQYVFAHPVKYWSSYGTVYIPSFVDGTQKTTVYKQHSFVCE